MKLSFSKVLAVVALSSILFNSCYSSFKVDGNVKLKDPDYSLETMSFYDRTEDRADRKIAQQIQRKLLKSGVDESGYYCFTRNFKEGDDDSSIYVFAAVVGATLGVGSVLYLAGLPTYWDSYSGTFSLYLFDSNGDFIKKFDGDGKTTGVKGLYYNTFDGDKAISKAINQIFEDMEDYADEINKKLKYAGPNSPEKERTALKKIETYFEENVAKQKNTSSSSTSTSSYSSAPSYSSSSSSSSSNSNTTLKTGEYTASGTDLKLDLSIIGTATLKRGYSSLGLGTYKIQGNRLVITFTSLMSEEAKELGGTTQIYIIQDDKCFYGSNATFVYTGW